MHRGRRLTAPPGETVRPTSDRAREALFNILSHGRFAAEGLPFAGRPVLDAFAGTGALGLEALSRGLTQKMLHGALAELHSADPEQRKELASTVSRLFLRNASRNPADGQN